MKEITRIHIAKVSYDIETSAKKELEKYVNKLELYADDKELLQDIEIRITEILGERGVSKDSVITSDDVKAVREQLGEPQEFMSDEGDIAVGAIKEIDGDTTRKLYRDKDSAILGGVLSGVARFFRVDPIWVRLVFIVLLFASFGTAALVYVVAWIAIPPARTAAEKLRMNGQPVTLGSIRELNETEDQLASEHRAAGIVRSVLLLVVGTLSALAAVGALFATAWGALGLLFGTSTNSPIAEYIPTNSWALWAAYILLVLAGLLLATLCSIFAYAAFKRTYSKRMTIATVAIIIAGVVSAGMAGSFIAYESWQMNDQVQRSIKTKTVTLTKDFTAVRQLTIDVSSDEIGWGDSSDARVEYVVSETPRYEITALPVTIPKIAVNGDAATITIERPQNVRTYFSSPMLRIYGPSLHTLNVETGSVSYSTAEPQEKLAVTSQENGGNSEIYGEYKTVVATGGSISLSGSSIETLEAHVGVNGRIDAGTVRHLIVTQPDVCPNVSHSYENTSRVVVRAVTSGVLQYNGTEYSANTRTTPCGAVIIGTEEEYQEEQE